jgi:hypothetical protein
VQGVTEQVLAAGSYHVVVSVSTCDYVVYTVYATIWQMAGASVFCFFCVWFR